MPMKVTCAKMPVAYSSVLNVKICFCTAFYMIVDLKQSINQLAIIQWLWLLKCEYLLFVCLFCLQA